MLSPSEAEVAICEFFIGGSFDPLADRSPHTVRVHPVVVVFPHLSQRSEAPMMLVGPLRPDTDPSTIQTFAARPPPQSGYNVLLLYLALAQQDRQPRHGHDSFPSLCRWNNLHRAASLPSAIAGNFSMRTANCYC